MKQTGESQQKRIRTALISLGLPLTPLLLACTQLSSPDPQPNMATPTATHTATPSASQSMDLYNSNPFAWLFSEPLSLTRFASYAKIWKSELAKDGVVELWRADSLTESPPDEMTLPGPGKLYVASACQGSRVSASALKGTDRVFWVMGEGCGDGIVFSGEKDFDKTSHMTVKISPDPGTEYVMIAYFIPQEKDTIQN